MSKKLVYIANIRLPTEKAHGIQIMKMCEAFTGQSLEVELLVPWRRNDLRRGPLDFYNIKKAFQITWIPCLDLVNFKFARIGFIISTLNFLIFSRLYLFFKTYDILYTREQLTGLFFRNFILELHVLPKKLSGIYRYLIYRADRWVVLTNLTKVKLLEVGFSSDKILALPDAVDMKEFDIDISRDEARKKLGFPIDKKIILYTGSFFLYNWKGGDLLLEAADFLNDDYLFVLVGGHPWELDKIRKSGLTKNCALIPYVGHNLIPYYLKVADILVLPNRSGDKASELYTSPLKLFEYMASQRPIISSNLPSLREIVGENEVLFFKPNDPHDLAGAIKYLSNDLTLQRSLAYNAYHKVKDYTWDKRAKSILHTYNQ